MCDCLPMADLTFDEINHILATPRYMRADLVRATIPPIDQNTVDNWLRRGWLDLANHAVVGGAKEFRTVARIIEENEASGTFRRYTGSDIVKVMTLQAISQVGFRSSSRPRSLPKC